MSGSSGTLNLLEHKGPLQRCIGIGLISTYLFINLIAVTLYITKLSHFVYTIFCTVALLYHYLYMSVTINCTILLDSKFL
jgi:hypothetical protein